LEKEFGHLPDPGQLNKNMGHELPDFCQVITDPGYFLNDSDALDEVRFILFKQAADGRIGKSFN
jgi:hypothetical protein